MDDIIESTKKNLGTWKQVSASSKGVTQSFKIQSSDDFRLSVPFKSFYRSLIKYRKAEYFDKNTNTTVPLLYPPKNDDELLHP